MASAFQSDAFQADAFQAAATFDAEAGALVLTGQDATFVLSDFDAEAGALVLAGQDASFVFGDAFTADATALVLSGQNADFAETSPFSADAATLTLAGQDAVFNIGYNFTADPGELFLLGLDSDIDAQIDQVFSCGVIIDLILPALTGNYRNYISALTVDSNPILIKEWRLEDAEQDLNAKLHIELADPESDRASITRTSDIDFTLTTNGTTETLLSNGNLKRKDYSISRQGIGPDDRVTFTALPDMEARLNTVPETHTVFYDDQRHTLSADDFEGIYDKQHNYTPPEVVPFPNMTLQDILEEVLITRCGFADYVTSLPEDTMKIPVVEFQAGQSYMGGLAGLIGMYEPEFIPFGANFIEIKDGTAGLPAGSPTPRSVTVSQARNIGVASDINRVDGLLILVSQERFVYDSSSTRVEVTTETEGAAGGFPTTYYTTQVTTTFRDYFRTEHPTRPLKTETVREVRVTSDGTQTVHRSTENFLFDSFGRMRKRTKSIEAFVPTPGTFLLGLNEVLEEEENLTYKMHPYQPRHYYVRNRDVTTEGLVFIDGENQQLGEDYARSVMDAYRAGNVIDTMTSDWAKIHTFKEQITPLRNNYVRIRRTEIDWLANQKHEDRNELRQGEVGVNIFINEQQKIYLTDAGTITGTVESVNMGDLDLDTAIALGERIRRNRNLLPNRVSFDLAYIDNSLQKGTAITAIGRNGENLGVYIIEARTLFGSQAGYFMTLQARQAD